uniref:Uncharacterized protein n=1 Tax=Cucumis melo TaxID=3656 RepID=A0A9I9EA66_CUCME
MARQLYPENFTDMLFLLCSLTLLSHFSPLLSPFALSLCSLTFLPCSLTFSLCSLTVSLVFNRLGLLSD